MHMDGELRAAFGSLRDDMRAMLTEFSTTIHAEMQESETRLRGELHKEVQSLAEIMGSMQDRMDSFATKQDLHEVREELHADICNVREDCQSIRNELREFRTTVGERFDVLTHEARSIAPLERRVCAIEHRVGLAA